MEVGPAGSEKTPYSCYPKSPSIPYTVEVFLLAWIGQWFGLLRSRSVCDSDRGCQRRLLRLHGGNQYWASTLHRAKEFTSRHFNDYASNSSSDNLAA